MEISSGVPTRADPALHNLPFSSFSCHATGMSACVKSIEIKRNVTRKVSLSNTDREGCGILRLVRTMVSIRLACASANPSRMAVKVGSRFTLTDVWKACVSPVPSSTFT